MTNTLLKLWLVKAPLGGVAMQVQEIAPLGIIGYKTVNGVVVTTDICSDGIELPGREVKYPHNLSIYDKAKDCRDITDVLTDFFNNCPAFQPADRTGEPEFGERVEVKSHENDKWVPRIYMVTIRQATYPVRVCQTYQEQCFRKGLSVDTDSFKLLRRLPATRKVWMEQEGDIYTWKESVE